MWLSLSRSPKQRGLLISLVTVALLLGPGVLVAIAGEFAEMVIFGDSHSDIGNYVIDHDGIVPPNVPLPWKERMSNGLLWVEYLANNLDLPPVSNSIAAGGTNYAYAGAKAVDDGTGVGSQIDQYLAEHAPMGKELFVLFAGHNDLVSGVTPPDVPLANLCRYITRLVEAGAEHILVANLPPLDHLPVNRIEGSAERQARVRKSVVDFNKLLAARLVGLQANPGITIYQVDLFGLVSRMIQDPASLGLTNVTDRADLGDVPNPDEYLYWGRHHYTTAAHKLFGSEAFKTVVPMPAAQVAVVLPYRESVRGPGRFSQSRFSRRENRCRAW